LTRKFTTQSFKPKLEGEEYRYSK